ncbi:MAG TPA: FtsX-like permease family protein [Gemmatimonadales bacterium]|nr:FtsX-like permease family protein [Gemmatimonadales bacterium]
MNRFRFALRHAWREGRAAPRRLALLAGTVALGVGALTALNGFTDNLRSSIKDSARSLMGADLSVSSNRPFTPAVDSAVSMAGAGGRTARLQSFGAMAFAPAGKNTRLVDVEAVDGGWPFYGEVRTDPAGAWARLAQGGVALVDPVLLGGLGVRVGDTLAIGNARVVIAGTLLKIPGDVGIRSAFAPRVYISGHDAAATGLLAFGSRVRYEAYVALPAGSDVKAVATKVRPTLRAAGVGIRTASDDETDLDESLTTLARYLGLIALAALLLGGVGVASASHELVSRRLETVAVLRCIGAPAGTVLTAYLVQAAAVGVVGGAVGALGGTLLQLLIPQLIRDFLPLDVHVVPSASAMLLGLGVGLWVTVAFALGPLLAVRQVPPLAALRRDLENGPATTPRDRAQWIARLALGASVVLLAALQVRSARSAVGFSVALGLAVLALGVAARGLIWMARRWTPRWLPYPWRQGLANLHRPANQTATVVLALGFGAFLLSTLFLVERSLIARFTVDAAPDRPNLVFFDIQPDQKAGIETLLRRAGVTPTGFTPIVPMRILSIKGVPTSKLLADTMPDTATGRGRRNRPSGWAVRREFRSTYRDSIAGSERVTDGRWWHTGDGARSPAPISIEEGLARELGVSVGDTIVWDVQGFDVPTRVANLRHVDWARFEPNFFVVFANGPIDRAPQTIVTLTRIEDPGARAALQRRVVEAYPNVSAIDASFLERTIGDLVRKVTLAIRFLALFSLAAGAAVLVGAVAASRRQRLREGVLLKTLGATRRQVVRIALAEYGALGLIAAASAIVLSVGAGWALMHWRFKLPFTVPVPQLLALGLGLGALSAIVGLWTGREVFRETALEVLRGE